MAAGASGPEPDAGPAASGVSVDERAIGEDDGFGELDGLGDEAGLVGGVDGCAFGPGGGRSSPDGGGMLTASGGPII